MKRATFPSCNRAGFTLIELLVVVAIIAILAGMLMPALSSARARAVSISCASRLKQIGTADSFYQNDYGYYCPLSDSMSPKITWFGTASSPILYDYTGDGYLTVYLKRAGADEKMQGQRATNVFFCPDPSIDKILTKNGEDVTSASGSGYGATVSIHGWVTGAAQGYPLVKAGSVKNPSSYVSFGDSAGNNTRMAMMASNADFSDGALMHVISNNHTCFRHSGKTANIAWVDGHVSTEKPAYIGSNPYNVGGIDPFESIMCGLTKSYALDYEESDGN